jgi:hypothetical protein
MAFLGYIVNGTIYPPDRPPSEITERIIKAAIDVLKGGQ